MEGFGAGGEFGGVEGEFGAVFGEAVAGVFEVEDGAVEGGDCRFWVGGGWGGFGFGFGFAVEATHGGGFYWCLLLFRLQSEIIILCWCVFVETE